MDTEKHHLINMIKEAEIRDNRFETSSKDKESSGDDTGLWNGGKCYRNEDGFI